MDVLADGERHTKDQLVECLVDEMGNPRNVSFHVQRIRLTIRPAGQDVLCEFYQGRYYYRLVRLVSSSYRE
jgi:hypothetical protein